MTVDSLSNALLGIVDSETWVASFDAGESRPHGAGEECRSKAPPFSNGGKRIGHTEIQRLADGRKSVSAAGGEAGV
jgi:hypothetical protein